MFKIFLFSNKSNKCMFLVMVERLDFEFFAYHFARVWELRHVLIIWNLRELSHRNLKATLWLVSFWEWHAQLCSADVCGEGEWDRQKKRLQGGYVFLCFSYFFKIKCQCIEFLQRRDVFSFLLVFKHTGSWLRRTRYLVDPILIFTQTEVIWNERICNVM